MSAMQIGSDVTASVDDKGTVHYKKELEPAKTGVAYVEPERAKTTRELEMEAGRKRVEFNKLQMANRPPRIISDKEKQAEGVTTTVFRPNFANADRLSTGLGPLMRRVNKPNEFGT